MRVEDNGLVSSPLAAAYMLHSIDSLRVNQNLSRSIHTTQSLLIRSVFTPIRSVLSHRVLLKKFAGKAQERYVNLARADPASGISMTFDIRP